MVTIRTCPSYQEETVSAALRQALADIGGLGAYARPGGDGAAQGQFSYGKRTGGGAATTPSGSGQRPGAASL